MMLQSQEFLTRQEIDARKSAIAVKDCFQVASNMFNNSTWIPCTTPRMHDLHPELDESRSLPLREHQMTRVKMKEKCDSLKKRLDTVIVNCENSGDGGLQRVDASPDWGHFDLEDTFDGDDRASFLPNCNDGRANTDCHLLCFWEKLDKEGHIQFTLAKLPDWIKSNAHVFSLVAAE